MLIFLFVKKNIIGNVSRIMQSLIGRVGNDSGCGREKSEERKEKREERRGKREGREAIRQQANRFPLIKS